MNDEVKKAYEDQIQYWIARCNVLWSQLDVCKERASLAKDDREALDWIEKKFHNQPWKLTGKLTGHWTVRESIKWILEHHEDYPMPADDPGRMNHAVSVIELMSRKQGT